MRRYRLFLVVLRRLKCPEVKFYSFLVFESTRSSVVPGLLGRLGRSGTKARAWRERTISLDRTCRLKRFWDPLSTRLATRFGPKHRLRGHSRATATRASRRNSAVETDADAMVAVTVTEFCLSRPSETPPVSQRRSISVVVEQNGKDCDHADHACGGHCGAGVSPAGSRYV